MKIKNLYGIIIILTSLLLIEVVALGDAPVVDITQKSNSQETSDGIPTTVTSENFNSSATEITPSDSASFLPTQPLSDTQRIARLEQQIKNLININLPQQIIDLQQQLAQVRGQLQEQQHDLQLVNKQLRTFYNNLNQRLIQLKNLNSDTLNDNSSSQKTTGNSFSNNGNIQLQDSTAYQIAINFLNKNQYDKSLAAFQNYLNNYPNGNYVANAHYWLGEIYLEQNNRKKQC
ncbi:YbgF trimerization domain-containing protein [Coxiella-like endosymbiont]|uniref:YbgF trimerization domain-containing protein n=1 Tax=Coxiella-like endosymbiont TaxID=1592897 RepID=UPI002868D2CB|nr:YbgF trimerization domain-containing protein [Coxiella-like endosymbiont]